MILVDTNVLLDMVTDDSQWADWSIRQLEAASLRGRLLMNAVVYAEFSVGYRLVEEVDRILTAAGLEMADIPRAALFLAGKAFQQYRLKSGARQSVLPDFFIGAHAAALDVPLLTRDARKFRTYFPTLNLIAP